VLFGSALAMLALSNGSRISELLQVSMNKELCITRTETVLLLGEDGRPQVGEHDQPLTKQVKLHFQYLLPKGAKTDIDALKAKQREISVQTIYDECGLRYAAIYRNPEALALFRANSTHLVAAKKRRKRKPHEDRDAMPAPRDPLLSYKKPQLVARLRAAHELLQEEQQQLAVQAEVAIRREARIAELEARLAELEPYRLFVEQMRSQMQREERGRFGDLPFGM
jgi:hypothetical protein